MSHDWTTPISVFPDWGDLPDQQVRNIRVENCVRVWKGLIHGGGYRYAWKIVFEHYWKGFFGDYIGPKPYRVYFNVMEK